jgi:serine/threonine protein kinase
MSFDPTYQRNKVKTGLEELLARHGVRSAVCYELFGAYDLLFRVWLPHDHDLDDFQEALVERLTPDDLIMCDPFVVRHPIRHWLFDVEGGRMIPPDEDLYTDLDDGEIEAIESGAAGQQRLAELGNASVIGDLATSPEKTDDDRPGIKFAVAIGGDPRLTTRQSQQFENTVTKVVDEATGIGQRSLYTGAGFGHFLIMGRLDKDKFYDLGDSVIDRINCDPIHNDYQARTYTHLSGQRRFLIFQESLIRAFGAELPRPSSGVRRLASLRRRSGIDEAIEQLKTRYEFRRELGKGGFAVVYEVFDTLEKEPRALKISLESGSSERIRRELGALRKVEHPHVVRVYWADSTDNKHYYIVSELVEGSTMEAYADGSKRLDVDDAISVADQLLDALTAIHPDDRRIRELRDGEMSIAQFAELQELQETGIVHRDIKPGNVVLGSDGEIKLLDFNIASAAGDQVLTRSGTPPYQPPDLPPSWDPTTDLFAVGVMLYQFITGHHPYPNGTPTTAHHPLSARQFEHELPIALVDFLAKAVAPYRAERFENAVDMREALRMVRRDVDLETHTDSLGERVQLLRQGTNLSIRELVERSGVEEHMLSEIENGELSPTIAVAKQLAEALDVSLVSLLGKRSPSKMARVSSQQTA